jgi:hypothetical protein
MSIVFPIFATLILFGAATACGMYPVRKLIEIYEGRRELKQGSTGWIVTLGGWSIIGIWVLMTWFCATVIGNWGATGDFDGAIDRSLVRLYVIMEIILLMLESD